MFLSTRQLPPWSLLHILLSLLLLPSSPFPCPTPVHAALTPSTTRQRIRLDKGWRFQRWGDAADRPDDLAYDLRPDIPNSTTLQVLKPWVLPSGNDFVADPASRHERPSTPAPGDGGAIGYTRADFDDAGWEAVRVPHDWAIGGPFYDDEEDPVVEGGMGRLPVQGVGWYRLRLDEYLAGLTAEEEEEEGEGEEGVKTTKKVYLDVDGAMSYAMVWMNGDLVGGWPYGYNSFRLDLTPHLARGEGAVNQLAVRCDNPNESARWYPGGGLYRSVWLTAVEPTHVAHWGTFITTSDVSERRAVVDVQVEVENADEGEEDEVEIVTDLHEYDPATKQAGRKVASVPGETLVLKPGEKKSIKGSATVRRPKLWQPLPRTREPSLYVAVTRLHRGGELAAVDDYSTVFGIRSVTYSGSTGLSVNGQRVDIRGVNNHHDLGALGAAFNSRAAERQLEILRDMGANAVRMAHNPPAPELLDLADRMGFLVMDEVFDSWFLPKTTNDFHLIFGDWHEQDLRSFMRRDRNHPSIILWSFGNEIGEQQTGDDDDAAMGFVLRDMMHSEDPTRPTTSAMNFAKPHMAFPNTMDAISLNYQGAGIRDDPAYSHLTGIRTDPQFGPYHDAFPEKLLLGSETSTSLSSRGRYIFPVLPLVPISPPSEEEEEEEAPYYQTSAPVNDTSGGSSALEDVSAYELYTADFGASPDKSWRAQDLHYPQVAGEFVWTGFDYLGEPTPYYSARSSYSGIVDLAGFPKDRYFLYEARWVQDSKTVHILPHWNWGGNSSSSSSSSSSAAAETTNDDRTGLVTPVHVFAAADEAELFLNGASQGRRRKGPFEYRFRWDDVVYEPGELRVVTYRRLGGGEGEGLGEGQMQKWSEGSTRTTGPPYAVRLGIDRDRIRADGEDVAFVTAEVVDERGDRVRDADTMLEFEVVPAAADDDDEGVGEGQGQGTATAVVVATDNGDPADMTEFGSRARRAFSGLALGIVRAGEGTRGPFRVVVKGEGGVRSGEVVVFGE